jgi:YjjW family glycine radical enzyme activase
MRADVSKILTWSVVDGPGNRLVLFLQGCNFACKACHNPHTIGHCNACGDCIPACHAGALSLVGGRIAWNETLCDACDDCLRACPVSANPMTRSMSVDEVLAVIRETAPFLTGITASGGEATVQLKFLAELFTAVKADPQLRHLTCFIDSNGHLGPLGWASLIPVTDGVMLDIKAFDDHLHRDMTGQSNAMTLAAARQLQAAGKLYEIRLLLVPGLTDTPAETEALLAFVRSLAAPVRIRLNAFQHHGVRGAARDWPKMTKPGLQAVAAKLRAAGIAEVAEPAVWL